MESPQSLRTCASNIIIRVISLTLSFRDSWKMIVPMSGRFVLFLKQQDSLNIDNIVGIKQAQWIIEICRATALERKLRASVELFSWLTKIKVLSRERFKQGNLLDKKETNKLTDNIVMSYSENNRWLIDKTFCPNCHTGSNCASVMSTLSQSSFQKLPLLSFQLSFRSFTL